MTTQMILPQLTPTVYPLNKGNLDMIYQPCCGSDPQDDGISLEPKVMAQRT